MAKKESSQDTTITETITVEKVKTSKKEKNDDKPKKTRKAKKETDSKTVELNLDKTIEQTERALENTVISEIELTQEQIIAVKNAIGFKKKNFWFFFGRIASAIILTALFLIPLSISSVNLFDAAENPSLLFSYKLLKNITDPILQNSPFHIVFWSLLFLPLTSILLLITLFIEKSTTKFCRTIIFLSLSIYLFNSIFCILMLANSIRWFEKVPPVTYAAHAVAAIYHISLVLFLIFNYRHNTAEYEKIKKFREAQKKVKKSCKISIKTKVAVTILATIISVLGTFMFLLLRDYHKMITEAVSDIGRSQAEQTAAVYDSADGKYDKIKTFFDEQRESNKYSNSPYERIDIIIAEDPGQIFLEKVDASTILPAYNVFAYTTGKALKIPDSEKSITAEDAHEYIKRYQNGTYLRSPVYDKNRGTCKYIHPVTFTRKAGSKLVGFSIVTYRQEVLMKTYFKTQVFVFTLSVLFIYIVIIITILLTGYITTPLIYLRSNVHEASNKLSEILSGGGKIGAESLVFDDSIKSKDEIKDLSVEINDLVSLIRGLIPYISFSTLKYADKESDSKKSYSRELCFLFTDIRGFTSMCEGRPPREIVSLLNHYLDLETEIILKNGGDIDKFVGDEMMAFFSGPRKEFNACKAAMEIRAAMREEQEHSIKDGTDFVSIGIGINTGRVTFGPVGSKNRMDFTSIGDTVNLAARLEGANKAYGSKAIITEAVYEKLKNSFVCRELDFITVKGKTEPVRIYEILQKKDEASETVLAIKELFEKGLALYRGRKWDEAKAVFTECNLKYTDMPSAVFVDRIRHFTFDPPAEDWDGVFTMKVK